MRGGAKQFAVLGIFLAGSLVAHVAGRILPQQDYGNSRISDPGYVPDLTGVTSWSVDQILDEQQNIRQNPQIWDGLSNYTLSQRNAMRKLERQYQLATAPRREVGLSEDLLVHNE